MKDAFRKVPVSPYDYWLLLFKWDGQLYVDICVPFGLATSPFLFNMFAEGLHWIDEYIYSQSVVHYLDDVLLIGGDKNSLFKQVCDYLGLEEKSSKSLDDTVVDFTGSRELTTVNGLDDELTTVGALDHKLMKVGMTAG